MDAKTQVEFDRIKAGPSEGIFTLLHHEGPVAETSHDVMERINYILRDKPAAEHYVRLRHIYPVPATLYGDYKAKGIAFSYWDYLEADHRARLKALDAPILALIPNCAWDGMTILNHLCGK